MKLISHQSQERYNLTKLRLLSSVLLLSVLTACGGSGAGDDSAEPDNSAALAIEPLVGVWDLPEDWNGEAGDEAYLVIRTPDSTGEAIVVLYDFDDASTGTGDNCFFIDSEGTVIQSLLVGSELFMDISSFPDAIVSLNAAGELVIVYTVGASVTTDRETNTLIANQLGITETDVTPACDF